MLYWDGHFVDLWVSVHVLVTSTVCSLVPEWVMYDHVSVPVVMYVSAIDVEAPAKATTVLSKTRSFILASGRVFCGNC